jgi:hypothetical protein
MTRHRAIKVTTALLGVALLCAIGIGVARRLAPGVTPSGSSAAVPTSMPVSSSPPDPADAPAGSYPPPQIDLPPSRLHERVDGAEPLLQSLGCRRLLYWRIAEPPADLEVLAFEKVDGARQALDRDAGSERTAGVPGDEGWANAQCVCFRHDTTYVRLIADAAVSGEGLLEQARRVEEAIAGGQIRP